MKKYLSLLLLACCTTSTAPEQGMVDINGTSLYYSSIGKGEPILIIHGGPVLDQSYMTGHFDELAKNYRLIFYDQRACGKSAAQVDSSSMTIQTFVNDIEGIRKKFELDKIHVLGHSWGGLLAVKYAAAFPEHTQSLILSNPVPPITAVWQEEEKELSKRSSPYDSVQRAQIMQSEEMKNKQVGAINKLMKLAFKTQFADTTMLDQLTIALPEDYFARSAAFQHMGPELFSYDLTNELQAIKCPALVMYGDYEPAAKLSGPLYKEKLTGSELVTISKSGHFPFIENKLEFFDTITNFLDGK